MHARTLRVLLESLDDLLLVRAQLVQRAQRLADADDIGPRILKVAATFEQWVDVKPAMFGDVSDEELAKYDKFISGIEEGRIKQEGILQEIKVR
jgi:programmed cell death 6-interacting protein